MTRAVPAGTGWRPRRSTSRPRPSTTRPAHGLRRRRQLHEVRSHRHEHRRLDAPEKFEFIYENAGTPRNDAADSTANLPADFPDDYWIRVVDRRTQSPAQYSTDGDPWANVGRPAPLPANAKIGLFSFSNAATTAPGGRVRLVHPRPVTRGRPSGPSFDDEFDGAALDKDRWNAIVRDTPSSYAVSGGALTITTEPGDIYTGDTNPPPNNFILQDAAHAGADWMIETKIDSAINGGYGQGGLIAYVDGDNYVKLDPISDAGQTRINRIELRAEVGGRDPEPAADRQIAAGTGRPFCLRLSKTGTQLHRRVLVRRHDLDRVAGSGRRTRWQSPDFGLFASGRRRMAGRHGRVRLLLLDGEDPAERVRVRRRRRRRRVRRRHASTRRSGTHRPRRPDDVHAPGRQARRHDRPRRHLHHGDPADAELLPADGRPRRCRTG